ncbi:hypothetical protein QWJ34_02100 [Saccharibacillus sp. CPCC 101409]|uniref:hypothetical protein n=1 Tax=Saccharibacillus sp. CPCC 101409 TaxID=3058041 RepID=UPI002673E040|nr:hypothetical protein [Saccharibacillus sp. CPCC 101409]MDO3408554.1 hypothetical protein [Saccharibacillus sp. CPCC 101409]
MMSSAMKGHTRQMASGLGGVLGTVTASGVKLDDFKHEIQDYLLAELPGMPESGGFKPGDRVLAIRVNGGSDIVVLCKVVGADG